MTENNKLEKEYNKKIWKEFFELPSTLLFLVILFLSICAMIYTLLFIDTPNIK